LVGVSIRGHTTIQQTDTSLQWNEMGSWGTS
jgi:hypothetical protein